MSFNCSLYGTQSLLNSTVSRGQNQCKRNQQPLHHLPDLEPHNLSLDNKFGGDLIGKVLFCVYNDELSIHLWCFTFRDLSIQEVETLLASVWKNASLPWRMPNTVSCPICSLILSPHDKYSIYIFMQWQPKHVSYVEFSQTLISYIFFLFC